MRYTMFCFFRPIHGLQNSTFRKFMSFQIGNSHALSYTFIEIEDLPDVQHKSFGAKSAMCMCFANQSRMVSLPRHPLKASLGKQVELSQCVLKIASDAFINATVL